MFEFGKEPFCNKKPETAPHFGHFCFPLCWRCLSLSVGIILSTILLAFLHDIVIPSFQNRNVLFLISLLIIIPCLIDGVRQATTAYISNNYLRGITGFFAGIGLRLLTYSLFLI